MSSGGRERRALTRAPWRARRRWILAAPGASCSRLGRRGPRRRGRRERKPSRSPPPAPPAPPAKPRPPAGAREPGRRVSPGPRQERPGKQVGHLPSLCTDSTSRIPWSSQPLSHRVLQAPKDQPVLSGRNH
eukprot:XP_017173813.1 PREDICTED: serine/arginine repetitive matrix protein 1-like [Mus musculus]